MLRDFWQIARICLINGKTYRASFAQVRSRAGQMRDASGIFLLISLPFKRIIVCDYGKAKIWVGETWTALVFVLLLFFSSHGFFPLLFSFYLCAAWARETSGSSINE